MSRKIINKIRNAVRNGNYDLTYHAVKEMAEDNLGIADIENAALHGVIARKEFDNSRGIKYIIEGLAGDQMTPVGIAGRFKETGIFLIITVYEIT
ncbi:MAG: DUF4258 domain-containing protein [Deltaproteobacteria bacterium]|nr:MAG: DUF4258 domain-containing protein [Deltaproteobacteria bacterium]